MEPLQGVENDIAQKNYVPSTFKNSCPDIKILNHIESELVKIPSRNLHIFLYCVICIVLVDVLCRRNVNEAIKTRLSKQVCILGCIVMLRARMFRSLIIRTGIKERNIRARNITI